MYLFRNATLAITKEISVACQAIYGMGWLKSNIVNARAGISKNICLSNINYYFFGIIACLTKRLVMSQVRIIRRINLNINKLIDHKIYKGMRHMLHLPVRGQRTRTNANTQRSKRYKLDRMRRK